MIVLIFSALILLRALLFKPAQGILMCGIWGGSFKVPLDKVLLKKIAFLAMINQERGDDSVGYFNGVELIKDADKNKKVIDFVTNVGFKPSDQNVFIGHNRKASRGMVNLDNAHPFDIDGKIIFAHNGTLENHFTLGTKYGIDHTGIMNDSKVFGMLLVKKGPKILEEYKGYAAIAVHRLDEPGSLYLFHGSSKEFSTDRLLKEERPLFYMIAKEGVFFSSIERSLNFIREDGDDEVKTLPHNILFCARNGQFLKKKISIHREEMNVYSGYPSYNRELHYDDSEDFYLGGAFERAQRKAAHSATRTAHEAYVSNSTLNRDVDKFIEDGKTFHILNGLAYCKEGFPIDRELLPNIAYQNDKEGHVYYYQNRHLIKGKTYTSDQLCHGGMLIDKEGKVLGMGSPATSLAEVPKAKMYYFFRGILMRDEAAYNSVYSATVNPDSALGRMLTRPVLNFAKAISNFSKYPVTNTGKEAELCYIERDKFFLDEKLAEGNNGGEITPYWSNRIYRYKGGKLIQVKPGPECKEVTFFPRSGTTKAVSATPRNPGLNGAEGKRETVGSSKTEGADEEGAGVDTTNDLLRSLGNPLYSDEFKAVKKLFYTVYDSFEAMDSAFGSLSPAYTALYLYAENICKERLYLKQSPSVLIDTIIFELYQRATLLRARMVDLLDISLGNEDFWISRSMETLLELGDEHNPGQPMFPKQHLSLKEDPGFNKLNGKVVFEDGEVKLKEEDIPREDEVPDDEEIEDLISQARENSTTKNIEDMINEEEMNQDDEAESITSDLITELRVVEQHAKELEELDKSEFAEKVVGTVQSILMELRLSLGEVCKKYKHNELSSKIKADLSSHSSILA